MLPAVATLVYALLILVLFWLDRHREAGTSMGLWVPTLWVLIVASRPVSAWLEPVRTLDSPQSYLEGSPLDAAIFAILLAAGLLVLVARVHQVGTILRANWPIIFFFAYCALSTLWSDHTLVSFKRWTKAVGDVVMVLVVLTDPEQLGAIKRLLTRVGFVLIPLSILLIKYYPDLARSYSPWDGTQYYSGVTIGKNLLGMTCLVCGLGSLWCFLPAYQGPKGRERTRALVAHGAVLVMAFWLFWMSNSMSSLACFVIAGSLMAVTNLFQLTRRPAVVHVLVAAVIWVTLLALFSDMGGGLRGSLGRSATLTGRTEIWKQVLGMRRNALVGTGFESFWPPKGMFYERTTGNILYGINEAHNGYLEVFLNLGWVGVFLLAVVIVTGYRNVLSAFRRDPHVGALKLAFFVACVVYSLTEAGFRMMTMVWIGFLLATTAVPEAASPQGSPPLGIEHTRDFAEPQPQLHHAFDIAFPEETS
jgi:O-antigen ligase